MDRWVSILVLAFLLLPGCSGSGERGWEDEAYMIHRLSMEDARWTVGHEDDATGGLDDVVRGAFLEPDALAFGDAGSTQRIYLAAYPTREVRPVGGPGDGPGEFRRLLWVMSDDANGVLAFDAASPRVQRFSRAGSVTESSFLPQVPGVQRVQAWAVLEDGHLLVGGTLSGHGMPMPGDAGLTEELGGLAWLPPGDDEAGELFWEGLISQWVSGTMGGHPTAGGHPWSPGLRVCPLSGVVAVTTRDAPEVALFDTAGSRVGEIRWSQPPAPLTPEIVDSWAEELLANADGALAAPFLEFIRSVELPDFLPDIREIRCDTEQRVWVEEFPTAGAEEIRWRVFHAHDGSLQAEVRLPGDLSLLAVGEDHLAAVHRDALDVQRIVWLPNPLATGGGAE